MTTAGHDNAGAVNAGTSGQTKDHDLTASIARLFPIYPAVIDNRVRIVLYGPDGAVISTHDDYLVPDADRKHLFWDLVGTGAIESTEAPA